jgi:hypothetical protein
VEEQWQKHIKSKAHRKLASKQQREAQATLTPTDIPEDHEARA